MKFRVLLALIPGSLALGQACDGALGGPCSGQEDCPGSAMCVRMLGKEERTCQPICTSREECAPSELCQNLDLEEPNFCGPPAPTCHPDDKGSDCECGMQPDAVRVQGYGDACQVLERDVSVCAWVKTACLDGGCSEDYFRYSLGDDSGYLLRRGHNPTLPEGWERDGSAVNISDAPPTSCPAARDEF